ncbi:hypothetical protein ACFQU7_16310 [Pseudoroseomonas wenyumeiae]
MRVIDALRRAGAWPDAAATAEALAATNPPPAVAQVVALETKLIAAQDTGRHTIASAMPPSYPRPHVAQQRIGRAKSGGGFRAWLARLFRRGG